MGKALLLFRRLDKIFFGTSILLVLIGLLMIYSTTYTESHDATLILRQILFFILGVAVAVSLSTLDYRYFKKISLILYLSSIGLLIAVYAIGYNARGSVRWFDFGFFRFQPVEFAKLALILFLANYFQSKGNQIRDFTNVLQSLLYVSIPTLLTIFQPDLGSAMILMFIWFGMLLATGVRKKHLLILLLVFIVVATIGWFYVLADYQKNRVSTFLDPSADPQGRGYNTLQSKTAVGSGGWSGRGLARGVVSQLRFLPERQTDFIFASLAEELGFFGTTFVLSLMFLWFLRIVRVAKVSRENFGFYISIGIFYYLFFQTVINVGMNLGLLPITGVPLPLVSYGGSSLMVSLASVGILESIVVHAQPVRFD